MNHAESISYGFLEGTKITCQTPIGEEVQANVETLRKGDLVKTLKNGYVPVILSSIVTLRPPNYADGSIHILTQNSDPNLTADLYMASKHCTLVDNITDEMLLRSALYLGEYNKTDDMHKIPVGIDPRFSLLEHTENAQIWIFALQHYEDHANYGIYANGILVESMSRQAFNSIGVEPLGNLIHPPVFPNLDNESTETS